MYAFKIKKRDKFDPITPAEEREKLLDFGNKLGLAVSATTAIKEALEDDGWSGAAKGAIAGTLTAIAITSFLPVVGITATITVCTAIGGTVIGATPTNTNK